MRKAGKINRFKTNVARIILCVHMFGMLVTNVLHPLHHAHSQDSSCYSGNTCSSQDQTEPFFSVGKKATQTQTAAGHSCTLCQWKVLYEFVFEEYRDDAPLILAPSRAGGYLTKEYCFDPRSHKRPRAPPIFC